MPLKSERTLLSSQKSTKIVAQIYQLEAREYKRKCNDPMNGYNQENWRVTVMAAGFFCKVYKIAISKTV